MKFLGLVSQDAYPLVRLTLSELATLWRTVRGGHLNQSRRTATQKQRISCMLEGYHCPNMRGKHSYFAGMVMRK